MTERKTAPQLETIFEHEGVLVRLKKIRPRWQQEQLALQNRGFSAEEANNAYSVQVEAYGNNKTLTATSTPEGLKAKQQTESGKWGDAHLSSDEHEALQTALSSVTPSQEV